MFKTLIDNFILSVPLLDVTTRKYVAFIDIFDILSYVVEVLNLPIESESWMMSSQFQVKIFLLYITLSIFNTHKNFNIIEHIMHCSSK